MFEREREEKTAKIQGERERETERGKRGGVKRFKAEKTLVILRRVLKGTQLHWQKTKKV